MSAYRHRLNTLAAHGARVMRRCARRLERERRAQFAAVLVVSLVCAVIITSSVASARSDRLAWSRHVGVTALTADVAAGDPVTAANTERIALPQALVPVDAVHTLPAGHRARVAMRARTPLTMSLLVPSPDAVTVPTGWRVIAMPGDLVMPAVTPGDRVDLVVRTNVVATGALVVSTDPASIAVPANMVAPIAAATRLAELVVAAHD